MAKTSSRQSFFRDAPILILDEPNSAIDAKAEYEIFQKVGELQKDKNRDYYFAPLLNRQKRRQNSGS